MVCDGSSAKKQDRLIERRNKKEYLHIRYSMPEWIVVLFMETCMELMMKQEQILQKFFNRKKHWQFD